MQIIEPDRAEQRLVQYLTEDVKKVGIVFYHGLGDCIQFQILFYHLRKLYPKIHFDIILQPGLGQKPIYPDAIEAGLSELEQMQDYDYIFLVHFHVEAPPYTKTELCCVKELGIAPISSYTPIPIYPNPLIGVHFQNTALPDVFNPSETVAKRIWEIIIEEGFIPIETTIQHVFHNPVNKRFDFVTCSARGAKPAVETLIGLVSACRGIMAVPSGPLHCALSIMPERVLYLEKGVPIERFTYLNIPSVKVTDEEFKEEEVRTWLQNMKILNTHI
jgi:hypothetical protein